MQIEKRGQRLTKKQGCIGYSRLAIKERDAPKKWSVQLKNPATHRINFLEVNYLSKKIKFGSQFDWSSD
jgi:hypothetical protein